MEVQGIDKTQSVKKLGKGEAVSQSVRVEDSLSISAEAHKRAEWVEALKAMPDVRIDAIETALSSSSWQDLTASRHAVAEKLLAE